MGEVNSRTKYLRAILISGAAVIGEFSRLGSVQKYAMQVFQRQKPFNAWKVVSNIHPVSGEVVKQRVRAMYNGEQIASIEEVTPRAGVTDHGYNPSAFDSKPEFERGRYGLWTAPEADGESGGPLGHGAVAGTQYPIHVDADSLNRYVILRAGVGDEKEGEVRYWLEGDRVTSRVNVGDLEDGDSDYDDDESDDDE